MILLPAIDVYEGRAVRLYQGDYRQMTVYADRAADMAARFAGAGAAWVHMVDLEGAKNGGTPNFGTVAEVVRRGDLKVEIGGGIRTDDAVARYLDLGVQRVILGTAALRDRPFLERVVARYGERIAVGVDCRNGLVATHGWTETSETGCEEFCAALEALGVRTIIVTDISRDGAMRGVNRTLYENLNARFSMDIVASGGVSSLEDVRALRGAGLYGAILGKAYYTGAVDLADALRAAGCENRNQELGVRS